MLAASLFGQPLQFREFLARPQRGNLLVVSQQRIVFLELPLIEQRRQLGIDRRRGDRWLQPNGEHLWHAAIDVARGINDLKRQPVHAGDVQQAGLPGLRAADNLRFPNQLVVGQHLKDDRAAIVAVGRIGQGGSGLEAAESLADLEL